MNHPLCQVLKKGHLSKLISKWAFLKTYLCIEYNVMTPRKI